MSEKLRKAMRDRDYYHRLAEKKLKSFVNNELKKSKAEYFKDLIERNRDKPDKRWQYINEVTGQNRTTPTCIVSDGVSYSDAQTISEVLNTHFCSIASKLAEKFRSIVKTTFSITASGADLLNSQQFCLKSVSVEYVKKQLKKLKRIRRLASTTLVAV